MELAPQRLRLPTFKNFGQLEKGHFLDILRRKIMDLRIQTLEVISFMLPTKHTFMPQRNIFALIMSEKHYVIIACWGLTTKS